MVNDVYQGAAMSDGKKQSHVPAVSCQQQKVTSTKQTTTFVLKQKLMEIGVLLLTARQRTPRDLQNRKKKKKMVRVLPDEHQFPANNGEGFMSGNSFLTTSRLMLT